LKDSKLKNDKDFIDFVKKQIKDDRAK
jgi:hypothetical protein